MNFLKKAHRPSGGDSIRSEPKDYEVAYRTMAVCVFIPFLLLFGRFWYLQVWQGEHYKQLAFNNFIKRRTVPAERGRIFDAKDREIATNRASYDVVLTPAIFLQKGDEEGDIRERFMPLAGILSMSKKDVDDKVKKLSTVKQEAMYTALTVKRGITRDQVAMVESHSSDFPGVEVIASSMRYYPYNDIGAHLIGYVNEITGDELKNLKIYGYHLGDNIGRTGLERSYESILRGADGLTATVVNVRGVPQTDEESVSLMRDWKNVDPISGKNLRLTIDMDLQRIVKHSLRNYVSGAVVVMDPNSGRILSMISAPSFNLNSWAGRLSREEHLEADNNPYKPMLDKSLMSYFPGSIYKVVTAAAALETGLITTQESLNCPGYYEYGKQRRRFHCWKHSGHDAVTLVESLGYSCDVYFYKVGEKLGMDTLAEYAKFFALGQKSGLNINYESAGIVPTKQWHNKHSADGFRGGFTLSTAIGQGDTHVSPLQMAVMYSAIANGGTVYYPQLLKQIDTPEGRALFEYPPRIRSKLPFKASTMQAIVDGLDMVVNNENGTAYPYRLNYVRVAGKTGTAQVTSKRTSNAAVEYKYRDHAWFAAFAPIEKPEIVVIVFLEHGGSGSSNAAPVAMEVIDRYFREIKNVNPAVIEMTE